MFDVDDEVIDYGAGERRYWCGAVAEPVNAEDN
jgi:hypothetical protein